MTPAPDLEAILATLPAEQAALLRSRLRPPSAAERLEQRDRLLRELAGQHYANLAPSLRGQAQLIATDLGRLQPIVSRGVAPHEGEPKRRLLAEILHSNGMNAISAETIRQVLANRRVGETGL